MEPCRPCPAASPGDVLERLGVALDRPDLDGLGRLYEAWRAQRGMENFSKRIALLEATDPTETARTPEATFEAFLRHGSSGTCWSTMEAFAALLKAAGFDARTYGGDT